jgi:hypothetical protein
MHWWDTSRGDPDSWTVTPAHYVEDEWEGTPYRTAEYLVRYLTNRLTEFELYGTPSNPPVWIPEDDERPRDMGFLVMLALCGPTGTTKRWASAKRG